MCSVLGALHARRMRLPHVARRFCALRTCLPARSCACLTLPCLACLQLLKPKKTEITDKLRGEINKVVNRYIDQGARVWV